MARFLRRAKTREVKDFGRLGFTGSRQMDNSEMDLIHYNQEHISSHEGVSLDQLLDLVKQKGQSWVRFYGLHDTDLITKLGESMGWHPLVVDKITDIEAHSSFEDYEDYLVLVLKMMRLGDDSSQVETEHLVIIVMDNIIFTFQENRRDPFDPILERMQVATNRIRRFGVDYMLFAQLRATLNEFGYVVEKIGSNIEELDEVIFDKANPELLEEMGAYNIEVSYLVRSMRPARTAILAICKTDSDLISRENCQFIISHVSDTTYLISEAVDNFRLMLHDQLNMYHTNVATRLNEMFRILTIFSVIFVPLTFIAGIYGMNFEFIPELKYHNSYFILLAAMFIIALAMVMYFKRKKWL